MPPMVTPPPQRSISSQMLRCAQHNRAVLPATLWPTRAHARLSLTVGAIPSYTLRLRRHSSFCTSCCVFARAPPHANTEKRLVQLLASARDPPAGGSTLHGG